jgi:DNA-binding NarL/FixJ family response regulator
VLAQPYELICDALEQLLAAAGLDVVSCCDRPADLDRCLRAYTPDVALVDADMAGGGDVADLIRAARRELGDGRLVMLVPGIDPALARATLALEVDGVVLKCARSADVIAAIRRVAAGDTVFPAGWLAAGRRLESSPLDELSPRQIEVLELIAQGLPNELVAERLFISRNTVKFHVAAIYQRLGISNRVQAAHALETLLGPTPMGGALLSGRAARDRPPGRAATTRGAVSAPVSRA